MNREQIELEWIEHCQEQMERCPSERTIWELAIEESTERLEAYRMQDEQAVRKPNS